MPDFVPRLAKLAARAGWRRLVFASFCLSLVALGAYYLTHTEDVDPRGRWEEEIAVFHEVVAWAIVVLALAALASPWLIGRGQLPPLAPKLKNRVSRRGRRAFWIAAGICVVGATLLWQARMDKSLWTDEVTSVRRTMVGRWKHNNAGEGQMLRPTWSDTLLDYHTPNNHVLYSVVARLLHDGVSGINDSDYSRPYFSAFVLRLPAFLAGLVAVALTGYLAFRLGSLLAAWLAMIWLAAHPWTLEFATSARGYAFAMALLALAVVAMVKVFRDGGGWRWWILYGLSQWLAFCSIPTILHGLVAMNLAVFFGIWFDRSVRKSSQLMHFKAFLTVNTMATIGAYLAFKPKLPQLEAYLESEHFESAMPWGWMADCVSGMLTGQPYFGWEPGHPWAAASEQWPVWVLVGGILLAIACAAAGLRRGWRGGVFLGGLAIACFLPPYTAYLQGWAMEFYLFPWYTVWHLPLCLVLFSVGAGVLLTKASARLPRWGAPAAGAGLALILLAATHAPRRAYLRVPVEPQRDSAAVFRESPNPFAPGHEKIISTSFITANHSYDPWNIRLRSLDDLWEQIAIAERTQKPLYCDTAWVRKIRSHHPEWIPVLLDESYFTQVERLWGLQPQNTRYVFRYNPGSLRKEALDRYPTNPKS